MTHKESALKVVGPDPSNGGAETLSFSEPYIVTVGLRGSADLLFHAWNVEAVAEKSKAAKGSKAKKSDNIESYVYRNADNVICIPGEYLRGSIITAAKFRQDPRSPRKSAMDLFKAGIINLSPLAPLGATTWDYEHACRVTVQRNGITRVRPAFRAGWMAEFDILVNLPEYINTELLNDVIAQAGKLIGIGDFRPTYGRFQIVKYTAQLP
jgi:hypothetical protein